MSNKKLIPFINAENEIESNVVNLATEYALNGADELFIYNYAKDESTREEFLATLKKVGKEIDIPFAVGCYVKRFEDVKKALYTGAGSVVIKKEILKSEEAVIEASKRFGKDKLFLEVSEEEFYNENISEALERMDMGGLLLKHVNTGEKLKNMLMKLDTQVIIRDSLVRNDLLTLCSYDQVIGISTNHFENKSILKVKRSLKAEGV